MKFAKDHLHGKEKIKINVNCEASLSLFVSPAPVVFNLFISKAQVINLSGTSHEHSNTTEQSNTHNSKLSVLNCTCMCITAFQYMHVFFFFSSMEGLIHVCFLTMIQQMMLL